MTSFEHVGGEEAWSGKMISVRVDRYRHADGQEVTRELAVHPGAAAIVAHDGSSVYMVSQPREAIGRDDVLEIPAGRLDVDGEPPEDAARRELAEELGLAADTWRHLTTYFSSAGFTNEELHLYVATGLREVDQPATEEDERIELVKWPLADLDGAIAETRDSKTLIGLLLLQKRLREG